MTPPDSQSQRVDERVPTSLVVTFKVPGRESFIERYAANVSKGGIFIVSREVHPVGSEIRFEIRSVDGATMFSGRGIVRWTKLHDPVTKQLPGLGIQFTELDAENRAVLELILAQQAAAAKVLAAATPLATPTEVSAQLHQGHAPDVTAQWPGQLPVLSLSIPIVAGKVPPPVSLRPASERFIAELSVEEKSALGEQWPPKLANRFRSALAAQWRLSMAFETRKADEPTDAAALDQLFGEADDALATVNDLAQSLVPQIQAACAASRGRLARLVQELLPTSDAAAIAADQVASEQTKRLQLQNQQAASAGPIVVERKKAGRKLRLPGPKAAISLALVSVVAAAITAWSAFAPAKIKPLPDLPDLPAGARILGNLVSGQVILQQTSDKPFAPEVVEAYVKSAGERGIRVTQLGPSQLLLEVMP